MQNPAHTNGQPQGCVIKRIEYVVAIKKRKIIRFEMRSKYSRSPDHSALVSFTVTVPIRLYYASLGNLWWLTPSLLHPAATHLDGICKYQHPAHTNGQPQGCVIKRIEYVVAIKKRKIIRFEMRSKYSRSPDHSALVSFTVTVPIRLYYASLGNLWWLTPSLLHPVATHLDGICKRKYGI